MRKKKLLLSLLLILLCAASVSLFLDTSPSVEAVREDLSEHILRFHVLANSDSEEDQALKLQVKSAVLEYLEQEIPQDADLKETKDLIRSRWNAIHDLAVSVITAAGKDYPVSLYLEPWYFPTKTYGDLTFPCGTYDAFRIVIGKGEGQNWWCVLYPSLCFVDSTYSVVPDESKARLGAILKEDTYDALRGQNAESDTKPKISFRLFEFFSSLF